MKDYLELNSKLNRKMSFKIPSLLTTIFLGISTTIVFLYFSFCLKQNFNINNTVTSPILPYLISGLIVICLLIIFLVTDYMTTNNEIGFFFEKIYLLEDEALARKYNILEIDKFKENIEIIKNNLQFEILENKEEVINRILNIFYQIKKKNNILLKQDSYLEINILKQLKKTKEKRNDDN